MHICIKVITINKNLEMCENSATFECVHVDMQLLIVGIMCQCMKTFQPQPEVSTQIDKSSCVVIPAKVEVSQVVNSSLKHSPATPILGHITVCGEGITVAVRFYGVEAIFSAASIIS